MSSSKPQESHRPWPPDWKWRIGEGTLVLVGTLPEEVTLPANLIMSKQLKVFGSFRFAHVFEKALTMVAAGKIDLDGMVTDTYGFDAVPQAMQRALSKDKVMKVEVAS